MENGTDDDSLSLYKTNTDTSIVRPPLSDHLHPRSSQSGAVSRTSEEPALHDSSSSGYRSLPLKIKRGGQEESRTPTNRKKKKIPLAYNNEYRILLNEIISQAVYGIESDNSEALLSSQLGATFWSPEEKQRFFAALGRLSRHNIRGIANAIGTKSEPEVQVYFQLLCQTLKDRHLHGDLYELVQLTEVPAASEIARECELMLEQAADALSKRQFEYEINAEKKKHDVWLLNRETAEHLVRSNTGITDQALDLSKANNLLNLDMLLTLSESIFMNSSNQEENWRFYAEGKETPSIFSTAFLDFYNLVISITKRLVQSALYFAMSRLKALKDSNDGLQRRVRREDVSAALNVLGVKDNKEYWVKVARRCKLHVSKQIGTKKQRKERLRYSEVERELMQTTASEECSSILMHSSEDEVLTSQSTDNEPPATQPVASEQREAQAYSTAWSSSSDSVQGDVHFIPAHFLNPKRRLKTMRRHEKAEDTYAQAYDLQESHSEEQRLWTLLTKEPAKVIKPENDELPTRPLAKRKDPEDLVDWRDHLHYRSPWERYDTPAMAKEFTRNKRICRRAKAEINTGWTAVEMEVEDGSEVREHSFSVKLADARHRGRHMKHADKGEGENEHDHDHDHEDVDDDEEEKEGEEKKEEQEQEDSISKEDSDSDSLDNDDYDDDVENGPIAQSGSSKAVEEREEEEESGEDGEEYATNSQEDEDEEENESSDFHNGDNENPPIARSRPTSAVTSSSSTSPAPQFPHLFHSTPPNNYPTIPRDTRRRTSERSPHPMEDAQPREGDGASDISMRDAEYNAEESESSGEMEEDSEDGMLEEDTE